MSYSNVNICITGGTNSRSQHTATQQQSQWARPPGRRPVEQPASCCLFTLSLYRPPVIHEGRAHLARQQRVPSAASAPTGSLNLYGRPVIKGEGRTWYASSAPTSTATPPAASAAASSTGSAPSSEPRSQAPSERAAPRPAAATAQPPSAAAAPRYARNRRRLRAPMHTPAARLLARQVKQPGRA